MASSAHARSRARRVAAASSGRESRDKPCRLNFLAGLVDSDGTASFESTFGPHVLVLGQGQETFDHVSILSSFAVVASSVGCDVNWHEQYQPFHAISRADDGTITRRVLPAGERQRLWEEAGFRRMHTGSVCISGEVVSHIPVKIPSKRLHENTLFDADAEDARFSLAENIRGGSHVIFRERKASPGKHFRLVSLRLEEDNVDEPEIDATIVLTNGSVLLA